MSDKSNPWANSSRRGRGAFIKVTAMILLAVALMWTFLYTQSLKTTEANPTSNVLEPAAAGK